MSYLFLGVVGFVFASSYFNTMATRSRRGRGRPPRNAPPLVKTPVNLRKPKAYQIVTDSSIDNVSGSNSRSSTPQSSRANSVTGRRSAIKPPHKMMYGGAEQPDDDAYSYLSPQEEYNDSDNSDIRSEDDMEFDNDMDDNVSEISESSLSTISSTGRQRWLAEDANIDVLDIPPMELPKSATDLLVDNEFILQAVGVYEILRKFQRILRLSPFRFEDFCMALIADEQSCLLSEVHTTLMRALQREEELNTTTFGSHDVKDHVNICFFLLDAMSFPEVIRLYIESEKFQTDDMLKALKILESADYCSLSVGDRLHVLSTLTDIFLSTNVVREELLNEGKIQYDDHCRNCHKSVLNFYRSLNNL